MYIAQNYRWHNGKVLILIHLHLKVALPRWRMSVLEYGRLTSSNPPPTSTVKGSYFYHILLASMYRSFIWFVNKTKRKRKNLLNIEKNLPIQNPPISLSFAEIKKELLYPHVWQHLRSSLYVQCTVYGRKTRWLSDVPDSAQSA